ncbi:MAG: hypothetical protein ACREJX_00930, partial [Polyangiaceae bacterium]
MTVSIALGLAGCSGADLGGISDSSSGANSPSGVNEGSGDGGGSSQSDGGSGVAADSGGTGGRDSGSSPRDGGSGSTGDASDDFSVDWIQGCWEKDSGKKYQAMNFKLTSSHPMPLEGTLFYNETCDPSDGTDNLNDTGGTTPPGTWLFWFIHHPDEQSTSAVWWFGDQ